MKKNYLLLAAFASALTFAACSNDELGEITNGPVANEVVEGTTFEIAISNQGVGTKAVRPITSSAADNTVSKIQLVVYKKGTSDATWQSVTLVNSEGEATDGKLFIESIGGEGYDAETGSLTNGIISYETADVDENVPGTDQHITKKAKLAVTGLQPDTKYQFVAYGYNDKNGTTGYPYKGTTPEYPAKPATGDWENGVMQAGVALDFTTESNKYALEEIFAATDVAEAVSDPNYTGEGTAPIVFSVEPSLTLTRQIAGMLAYFKNVTIYLNDPVNPTDEKQQVYKLQIVANHTAKDFYFPAVLLENEDFNGVAIDPATDEEDILMTFDFSKIATNFESHDDADFYTFNEYNGDQSGTKKPQPEGSNFTSTNMYIQKNTIFGARYLLPYDKHYSDNTTLVIRFFGKNDVLLEERRVTTANVPDDGTMYTYDIRCNNFYSIGVKTATDTEPDPGENPDPDEDDPMDLTGKEIMVVVNDAWAVLHNMGVE